MLKGRELSFTSAAPEDVAEEDRDDHDDDDDDGDEDGE
jgi:hypothetical protein